jgi:hypothetical protein
VRPVPRAWTWHLPPVDLVCTRRALQGRATARRAGRGQRGNGAAWQIVAVVPVTLCDQQTWAHLVSLSGLDSWLRPPPSRTVSQPSTCAFTPDVTLRTTIGKEVSPGAQPP